MKWWYEARTKPLLLPAWPELTRTNLPTNAQFFFFKCRIMNSVLQAEGLGDFAAGEGKDKGEWAQAILCLVLSLLALRLCAWKKSHHADLSSRHTYRSEDSWHSLCFGSAVNPFWVSLSSGTPTATPAFPGSKGRISIFLNVFYSCRHTWKCSTQLCN